MKIRKYMLENLILICAFSYIYAGSVYATEEVKTFKVGVCVDMIPYESYNSKENSVEGIIIDYFKQISENTGMNFVYECIESSDELAEKLEDGQIDIVASVMDTGNKLDITLSEPCFNDKMVVVVSKGSIFSENYSTDNIIEKIDSSMRVGVVEGHNNYNVLINKNDTENYRYYASYKECMGGLLKNEIDYTILPELCVYKVLEHSYYEDVLVYPYPDSEYSVCIGVSNRYGAEVLESINAGIEKIDEYTREQILLNNMVINGESPDIRDFVADYKKYIYGMFGAVAIITALLLARKLIENKDSKFEAADDIVRAYSGMLDTDVVVKTKEMLLSKLSHDMRNPMNSIMGMTELARDNVNNSGLVTDYLDDILSAGKYLLSLINDILDMARIESGKMVLRKERLCLFELFSEINTMVVPLAKKKDLKYTFAYEGDSDVAVIADKHRLQQIIINVVGNAIKFTGEGGKVDLYINVNEINSRKIGVFICVKDTGIGIADEVKLRLFEPFFQENRYGERNGGSGLGLTIVNELVNLMDGHIKFASELGKGTEITLEISFDKEKHVELPVISEKEYLRTFAGKRVLVVDDSEMNLDMMEGFLEKYRFKVDRASDGESCCRKFMESDENYYQFIIIDINMPDMNGDRVAKLIRKSGRNDAGSVKIIGLSAEDYDEEEKRKLYTNMDGYMTKPMESKVLFKILHDLIR